MHTLFRQCPTVLQSPETFGLIPAGVSKPPRLGLKRGTHTPTSSSSSLTQPSLLEPACPDSTESLARVPVPRPQPSRRNFSASRPGHTPKSSSDRWRGETVEPHGAKPARPESSVLYDPDSPRRTNTLWSTDDSFLPRAKPPPPLKRIHHERTRSAANVCSPERRSSTSSRASSHASSQRSLSKRSSERLRPWSPSLDTPVLDISSEHSNKNNTVADNQQHASANRMTVVSEVSEVSEICFSPAEFTSGWKWMPPSDWAGPSTNEPIIEDARGSNRQFGCVDKKKGGTEGTIPVFARLNRTASRKKLKMARNVSEVDIDEEDSSDSGVYEGRLASEPLKVKCYERNGWQEKCMADVIPILRKLKSK